MTLRFKFNALVGNVAYIKRQWRQGRVTEGNDRENDEKPDDDRGKSF